MLGRCAAEKTFPENYSITAMDDNHYCNQLKTLLLSNEEWLMERILHYARQTDFTTYTSTLQEAWRLSISGLTSSIVAALDKFLTPPELHPEYQFDSDPISRFGVIEARKHRQRGISLAMFLCLFKYYRLTYLDLVSERTSSKLDTSTAATFLQRIFDIIEIAFTVEWAGSKDDQNIQQLQIMNRRMTNEKNKYLTIFDESAQSGISRQ